MKLKKRKRKKKFSDKPEIEDVGSDKEKEERKGGENKEKKIKEKYSDQEELNNPETVWTRNPDNITEEECGEFY